MLTLRETYVTGRGVAVGFTKKSNFEDVYQQYKDQEYDFILVKSHTFISEAVSLFENNEARAIYVYRDTRDVVISQINKTSKIFEHAAVARFIKRTINMYGQWQSVDPILVSRYEQMVMDLKSEAHRIAQHLGIKISDEFAAELEEKYGLEQQKKRIASIDYENQGIKQKKGGRVF